MYVSKLCIWILQLNIFLHHFSRSYLSWTCRTCSNKIGKYMDHFPVTIFILPTTFLQKRSLFISGRFVFRTRIIHFVTLNVICNNIRIGSPACVQANIVKVVTCFRIFFSIICFDCFAIYLLTYLNEMVIENDYWNNFVFLLKCSSVIHRKCIT